MIPFLIIAADFSCGRGARGLNLYRFLSIFHGRRAVRMMTTQQLLDSKGVHADRVFIGMPSAIGKAHLAKLRYRQAHMFDYQDCPGPAWLESDRELLLGVTDGYLKPWAEKQWDYGVRMGVLPIRRYFKLTAYLKLKRCTTPRWNRVDRPRPYDISFIGNAFSGTPDYNQRIAWLNEIHEAANGYRFWGGLVIRKYDRAIIENTYGDVQHLLFQKGRVDFLTYIKRLVQSKIALTPGGNARWSYRLYEAIYAGALLVSADFQDVDLLIPLPVEHMIHVPDRQPVLPAVEAGLTLLKTQPEVIEHNIAFVERYLTDGDYTRQKPEVMDRFLTQLD